MQELRDETEANAASEAGGAIPANAADSGNTDYMVRAIAGNGGIRAFAVRSRNLVEEAHKIHNTSNVVTAALGRTLSAGLMMGSMLKEDQDSLTIRFDGDGPIGSLIVTADARGHVRGTAQQPLVMIPLKENGHLDVGTAIGKGTLMVIRDIDRSNTYSGNVPIYNGEIAEDLTHYFAESEQIPSSVGLGVLADARSRHVLAAGGFLIQLMPGASEEDIATLEQNILAMPAVTDLLRQGMSPEQLLESALQGLSPRFLAFDTAKDAIEAPRTQTGMPGYAGSPAPGAGGNSGMRLPVSYYCECSHERFGRGLQLLGKAELEDLRADKKPIELRCHFCGKRYVFSPEELDRLYAAL